MSHDERSWPDLARRSSLARRCGRRSYIAISAMAIDPPLIFPSIFRPQEMSFVFPDKFFEPASCSPSRARVVMGVNWIDRREL